MSLIPGGCGADVATKTGNDVVIMSGRDWRETKTAASLAGWPSVGGVSGGAVFNKIAGLENCDRASSLRMVELNPTVR